MLVQASLYTEFNSHKFATKWFMKKTSFQSILDLQIVDKKIVNL